MQADDTADKGRSRRRARILVSGRVQGVSYRASARKMALELGLSGWVRNLFNGGVEILAEGEQTAVAAFIAWCGRGPRWASVDRLDVADLPPEDETSQAGFEVIKDA